MAWLYTSIPSGAVCSPSCVIPPSDPVLLPENVTTDTLEHWMEPVKVQVREGSVLCIVRAEAANQDSTGRTLNVLQISCYQTSLRMIPIIKDKLSDKERKKSDGGWGIHLKGKLEIRLRDISNEEESE